MAADEAVRRARAYLSRVAEPGSVPVWAWVRTHGPLDAAARIRAGEVPSDVRGPTEARATSTDPDLDLAAAERHGLRLVVPEDDDWPHFALAALERSGARRLACYRAGERTASRSGEPVPPLALWVRGTGDLAGLGLQALAIVGSRAATAYGEQLTREFAYGVARRGVTVISGGAYGIDAAAHRAALAAGGAGVLVSAGGLDSPYPSAHVRLYDEVAATGLLVSESPPGATPQRHRFLSRNRLIAALSTATLVVEAARRSGAMNTAHHASTLGRPLLAVPGPVTSPMSAGCHELIRRDIDPALLVSSVDDLLAVVGGDRLGRPPAESPGSAGPPVFGSIGPPNSPAVVDDPLASLDTSVRLVLDGLPARSWARPDAIARRSGAPLSDVLRALPLLELLALVETRDGGYRISTRIRSPARPG